MKEKLSLGVILGLMALLCIWALGFAVTAHAVDVPIKWAAVDGATGYKIYKSEDMRQTWNAGLDVGIGTPVGNEILYTYPNVREDGPVDFRVSAYNATSESIRLWSGAWYDHTLRPVKDPGGAGIE